MGFIRKIAVIWLLALVGFLGGIGIALYFDLLSETTKDNFAEEGESMLTSTSTSHKAVSQGSSKRARKTVSAITDLPALQKDTLEIGGATVDRKVYKKDLSSLDSQYLFALLQIQGDKPETKAILLSDDSVIHSWEIASLGENQHYSSSELQPNGSLLLSQITKGELDTQGKLSLFNACSKQAWSKNGTYQFYSTIAPKTHKWFIQDDNLVQIDLKAGSITKTIRWDDVRLKNPEIHLDLLSAPASARWASDPWDFVDVEPLPADKQALFPSFNVGDLLITFKQISLLVVIDPETLEIKWWTGGTTRKPMDVDWLSDGTIGASNGNNRVLSGSWKDTNRHSNFVQIDPVKYNITKRLEFPSEALYSPTNFSHQLLSTGSLLINSEGNNTSYTLNKNNELLLTISSPDQQVTIKDSYWVNKNYFIKDINEVSNQCTK